MKIENSGHSIIVHCENGTTHSESSVTVMVLFKILEKLDDIENRLIDIDAAVDPR